MSAVTDLIRRLEEATPDIQDIRAAVLLILQQWETVKKQEDFAQKLGELTDVVRQLATAQNRTEETLQKLAQAQKGTEESIERLTQRVDQLAERVDQLAEQLGQLADAQRHTEECLEKLTQRVDQLAERVDQLAEQLGQLADAQRHTEERLEKLTQRVDQLAERVDQLAEQLGQLADAQRHTEERLEKLTQRVDQLAERIDQLAEQMGQLADAQRHTEERLEKLTHRVDELAQAQKHTEERVEQLAEAQKRTEKTLHSLIREFKGFKKTLGGITDAVGYGLEDRIISLVPAFASRQYDLQVKAALRRFIEYPDGRTDELNIYAEGLRQGKPLALIGECKSQPGKNDLRNFARKVERLKRHLGIEVEPFLVGYSITPEVARFAAAEYPHIKLYWSYQFEILRESFR